MFTNFITSYDLYGKKVELSFDGKGSSHNTLVGGIVSIFIKSFMLFYIVTLNVKLFTFGDDATKTEIVQTSENETVYLNQTGFIPSFSIVNITSHAPIIVNDDMKKYVTIHAGINDSNYTSEFAEVYHELGIKPCTASDFNSSNTTLAFFTSTSSYQSINCFDNYNEFKL